MRKVCRICKKGSTVQPFKSNVVVYFVCSDPECKNRVWTTLDQMERPDTLSPVCLDVPKTRRK